MLNNDKTLPIQCMAYTLEYVEKFRGKIYVKVYVGKGLEDTKSKDTSQLVQ